jgi:hypothetical protein
MSCRSRRSKYRFLGRVTGGFGRQANELQSSLEFSFRPFKPLELEAR